MAIANITNNILTDSGIATSSLVPYTGASADVNLGFNNFDANQINGFKIIAKLDGTSSGSLILRTGTSGYSYGGDSISLISSPTSANTLTIVSDVSSVTKIAQIGLGSLTATRTFTLPDTSGTLALTSNLSAYLPLSGGTLTGALGGTSASFSSSVTATAFIPTGSTIPTNGMYRSAANTLNFATNSANRFTIASDGVATFGTDLYVNRNIYVNDAESGVYADFYGRNSTSTSTPLAFLYGSAGTVTWNNGGTKMTLDSSGRLGIGTSSPTEKFEVIGGAIASSNGTIKTGVTYSSLGLIGTFTNHDLGVITSGSEKMRITSGGNVGIGTSSPTSISNYVALTINGTSGSFTEYQQGGSYAFRVGSDSSIGGFISQTDANPIRIFTNSTERMRITSGGQLYFSRNSGGTDIINIEAYTGFTGRGILLNMDAGSDAITIGGAGSQNAINVTSSSKKVIISNLGGSGTVTVQADNSGTLIKSSDSSLKQEDKEYKIQGLAEILQLQPRAYKWLKDIEIRKEEAVTEIGFFADEVNPIIPSAAPKGFDGLYGFNDRAVTAALVKSIQELEARIKQLENK